MLGVHCSGKISMQISWRMDLWERGSHSDLVGDTEAEGAAREERAFREEEEDVLVRRFLGMVLLGKLQQDVQWVMTWEGGESGGGVGLVPEDSCINTR